METKASILEITYASTLRRAPVSVDGPLLEDHAGQRSHLIAQTPMTTVRRRWRYWRLLPWWHWPRQLVPLAGGNKILGIVHEGNIPLVGTKMHDPAILQPIVASAVFTKMEKRRSSGDRGVDRVEDITLWGARIAAGATVATVIAAFATFGPTLLDRIRGVTPGMGG